MPRHTWVKKNPEKARALRKTWYEKNRAREQARSRNSYAKNKQKRLEQAKKRYYLNKEQFRRNNKAWIAKNRDKIRESVRKKKGMPSPIRSCPLVCECCGQQDKRALCLDHCHKTGKFRGWLCRKCNIGLGSFSDSKEILMLAIEYLSLAEESWSK